MSLMHSFIHKGVRIIAWKLRNSPSSFGTRLTHYTALGDRRVGNIMPKRSAKRSFRTPSTLSYAHAQCNGWNEIKLLFICYRINKPNRKTIITGWLIHVEFVFKGRRAHRGATKRSKPEIRLWRRQRCGAEAGRA